MALTTYRRRRGRPAGRGGAVNFRAIARRKAMRRGRRKFGRTRPFYYKQTVDGVSINGVGARFVEQSGGAAKHVAMEFRAQDVPNWSAFSSLYDQYQITKIVVKMIPMITNNTPLPSAGLSVLNPGITGTVIDVDDAVALTSLNQYEQYESFKFQNMYSTRPIVRTIVPHSRTYMVQAGGASVPAGTVAKKWYDCAYGAISHCGLKWYLDQYYDINSRQYFQVLATYYIKFRNVR